MSVSIPTRNRERMKTYMTDIQDSPEVYWYAQSPDALPDSYGTIIAGDEAVLQRYRDAGMTAEAERQEAVLAQRKESAAHEALASHHFAMGDVQALLKNHFNRKEQPRNYRGKGDEQVPTEVLVRLMELQNKRLCAFNESMLADREDEPVFDEILFWIADDGEVLIVGSKRFGNDKRKYLVGQWRPDGARRTSLEDLQNRQQLETQQAEEVKARKRRKRSRYNKLRFAGALVLLALMVLGILKGNFASVYPLIMPIYFLLLWPVLFGSKNKDDESSEHNDG